VLLCSRACRLGNGSNSALHFYKVHFSDSFTSIRALSVEADGVHSPRPVADSVHTGLSSRKRVAPAVLSVILDVISQSDCLGGAVSRARAATRTASY